MFLTAQHAEVGGYYNPMAAPPISVVQAYKTTVPADTARCYGDTSVNSAAVPLITCAFIQVRTLSLFVLFTGVSRPYGSSNQNRPHSKAQKKTVKIRAASVKLTKRR